VKEQTQKALAEAAEVADLEEVAFLYHTGRSLKGTVKDIETDHRPPYARTPPRTPVRGFVRVKDAICKRGPHNSEPLPIKAVGAFAAHVSACPGTGFLPKPNHYHPGAEPSLGPMPKKLNKGDYPAGYVFARHGRMMKQSWPNDESKTPGALRADRREQAATLKQLNADEARATMAAGGGASSSTGSPRTELNSKWQVSSSAEEARARALRRLEREMEKSASAPQLSGTTGGDSEMMKSSMHTPLDSDRRKLTIGARVEGTLRQQNQDAPFGASSFFLATKEQHYTSWQKGWKQLKHADSGQRFYWGC